MNFKTKKLLNIVLSIFFLSPILTGCKKDKHNHNFNLQVIGDEFLAKKADYDSPALYFYSCDCGEKGKQTFSSGEPLEKLCFDASIKDFKEIDYIEVFGSEAIDTFLEFNTLTDSLECKFMSYSKNQNSCILSTENTGDTNGFSIQVDGDSKTINVLVSDGKTQKVAYCQKNDNEEHILRYANSTVYYDGKYIRDFNNKTGSTNKLYLFSSGQEDCFRGRMYYTKIYNNSLLIRDFQPVISKDEKSCGLFEKVENKFYMLKTTKTTVSDDIIRQDTRHLSLDKAKLAVWAELNYNSIINDKYSEQVIKENYVVKKSHKCSNFELNYSTDLKTTDYALLHRREYFSDQIIDNFFLIIGPTQTPGEWASNMFMGEKGRDFHQGFEDAAKLVYDDVAEILLDNPLDARLLVAGYSRGSPIAAIISSRLMEGYPEIYNEDTLAAYLYACPNYSTRDITYENLFIFDNPGDIFPTVPFDSWGFHVEGRKYLFTLNYEIMDFISSRFGTLVKGKEKYEGFWSTYDFIKYGTNFVSNIELIYLPEIQQSLANIVCDMFLSGDQIEEVVQSVFNILISSHNAGYDIDFWDLLKFGLFIFINYDEVVASHECAIYVLLIEYIYSNGIDIEM